MPGASDIPVQELGGERDPHRVLAGFMDDGHLQQVLQATLPTMSAEEQDDLADRVESARAARQDLDPIDFGQAVNGELPPEAEAHADRVRQTDDFQDVYGERNATFRMVDPATLCAFQTHVKTTYENPLDGTDLADLLPYCLPQEFSNPTEAAVSPNGRGADLTLSADSPNVTIHGLSFGDDGAHVDIGSKRNWFQVAIFNGRPYLKNGYHRALQLLREGVEAVPAIVDEAESWDDTGGNKPAFFGYDYLAELDRPPVTGDLLADVAVEVPLRRTKKIIRIEVDEFKVPV